MPSQLNLKEDAEVFLDPSVSLKQFPLVLRKIGKYLLQNNEPITIKEVSEKVNVNYKTVRTLIWNEKKKGNDFYKFIDEVSNSYLNESLLAVDTATVEGAVNGAHQDRKLYYERIGKLKDTANININHLTIGVNVQGVQVQEDRDKGVIDVQPLIPKT